MDMLSVSTCTIPYVVRRKHDGQCSEQCAVQYYNRDAKLVEVDAAGHVAVAVAIVEILMAVVLLHVPHAYTDKCTYRARPSADNTVRLQP